LESEILGRYVVADQFDLLGVRDAESALVCHPQERDRHRIEAHEPRRNRVDRDRV
jgi:hypothetical protein